METSDKCAQGKAPLKHQNYCHVTLHYNTEERKMWNSSETKQKQRKKKSDKQQTSKLLRLWKPESRRKKKVKISVELHSFPPPAVRFKSATCGFLLVQADSKYHFIMSSTFLPSFLSPRPSILSCVRDGRHRNSCVTVCAV